MKFRLERTFGAKNSPPIFDAFQRGLLNLGHQIVDSPDAIPVIWSVLWRGRMQPNKSIYHMSRSLGIPVVIIEVGNLLRNRTWRISVNNVNRLGYFGNDRNIDTERWKKFKVRLKEFQKSRKSSILITLQHSDSLQWEGMSSTSVWLKETIDRIRQYSDRPIVVRPHPRAGISINLPGITVEQPRMIAGSYDDYNLDTNFHCVINFCSGPAITAAINGSPVIVDPASLAYPVSEKFENIENLQEIDREDWFHSLTHTEWFVEEIEQGLPISRISEFLENNLKK